MINEDNNLGKENRGKKNKKNKMKRVNDEVRMEQLGKIGDVEIGIGKNDKNGNKKKRNNNGIIYSANELKREIKIEELANEMEYEGYREGDKIPKRVYDYINSQIGDIFNYYPIPKKKGIMIEKGDLKYLVGIIEELKKKGYKVKINKSGEYMGIWIWVLV